MSFVKLKADELRLLAAEGFAVDVPEGATKPQILAALSENGITWDQALQSPFLPESYRPVVEETVVPTAPPEVVTTSALKGETTVQPAVIIENTPPVVTASTTVPDTVLIKMSRENPRYDIRGYKFTKDHPFALVRSDDAEYIVSEVEGFGYATPREAKEFYG